MAATSTQITAPFYSTGFHQTNSDAKGQFLKLRRDGQSMSRYINKWYSMGKFLAYQTSNLLEVLSGTVSITPDTVPDNGGGLVATNLLNNLGSRRCSTFHKPMIDINGNKDNSIESCFRTDQTSWSDPNTFILGVDLGDSFFVHTVLLVEDFRSSDWPTNRIVVGAYAGNEYRFQRFEVYVGDNADYLQNEKV